MLSDIPTKETPGMKRKPKWATDFISMPHIFKFVVSSGERELWFYDVRSCVLRAVCCVLRRPYTPSPPPYV